MLTTSLFFMLFLLVSIFSLIRGIQVLWGNPNEITHRLFFALEVSLILWALGFGMGIIASSAQNSIIGRRIASLGWSLFFPILLHFLLTFAKRKVTWATVLIYLPASVMIAAFVISSGINPHPYEMEKASFGYVNISRTTYWDILSYLYYFLYTLVGLVVVLGWSRSSFDEAVKHQAHLLFIILLFTLALGTLSDILLESTVTNIPQLSPLVIGFGLYLVSNMFDGSPYSSKQEARIQITFSVVLYVSLALLQARYQPDTLIIGMGESTLRGIITQLQMIISIYLVLRQKQAGFLAALVMNGANLAFATMFLLRTRSSIPVPGIISYIGVLLLVLLIRRFEKHAEGQLERINTQKDALVESEKQLYTLAYYDTLTSLPNRDLFTSHVEQSIQHAKQDGSLLGILFIDFDSFKSINDTAGHTTGDLVLRQIASGLSKRLGSQVLVARFGGDEFLIELRGMSSREELEASIDIIIAHLRKPVRAERNEYYMPASIGVAIYPHDGEDPQTLIMHADIAMYAAKARGKNQVAYCTTEMKDRTSRKLHLANSLYRALDMGELFLVYQPQVCLKNQKVCGFEALIRWNHPELGLISPSEFISLAEQNQMIRPIGNWVIKTACWHLKHLQQQFGTHLSMSVNVSLLQLKDQSIIDTLQQVLKETGLQASSIQIEVTETKAFMNEPIVLSRLEDIRLLGLRIAIDDFGTGHSSFSRLKSYPIDLLKIDIEFVRGISSGSKKNKGIIKSIIQIAKNLDLDVVAEGVETEEQLAYLAEQNCDKIQGYYFYMPMTAEDTIALLREKSL